MINALIGNDTFISKARGQWVQKEIGKANPWIFASFAKPSVVSARADPVTLLKKVRSPNPPKVTSDTDSGRAKC